MNAVVAVLLIIGGLLAAYNLVTLIVPSAHINYALVVLLHLYALVVSVALLVAL